MVLRSIGVLSCGKVLGTMYAAMGLIIGGIFSLLSMAGVAAGQANPEQPDGAVPAAIMGVGAVILLPILYGLMGFIGGIISAAIYNFIAAVVGGIELNFAHAEPDMSYTGS